MHVLGAWEDRELLAEPVKRATVLADTQQQARRLHARTEAAPGMPQPAVLL